MNNTAVNNTAGLGLIMDTSKSEMLSSPSPARNQKKPLETENESILKSFGQFDMEESARQINELEEKLRQPTEESE